jgi:tetratricopeptide (TPR) repeat protein
LLRAQLALEAGDHASARGHFAKLRVSEFRPLLGAQVIEPRLEALVRMADVCVVVGTRADAEGLYARIASRAQRIVHDGALLCWGAAARPLGELACMLGRYPAAERHLADALRINEQLGHRPELVRTQLAGARLLLALGRAGEARAAISVARAAAQAMDMRSALALAAHLAAP